MSDPSTDVRPSRVPEFASLEEEAASWDTHETTDFEDEFHPVTVVYEEHWADALRSKKIAIRLDADTDPELTLLAPQQGLQKSSLVRSVVQDFLRDRHRNTA